MSRADTRTVLAVDQLEVRFPTRTGEVKAVDRVSLRLGAGETLGVVGESGSGKSATALAIMRLLPPPGRVTGGTVKFRGRDITSLPESEVRSLRGAEIAMIFQDPMTSLNPVLKVGTQVGEPLAIHESFGRRRALDRAITGLREVGIADPETRSRQYPHEFSGGMRQRAMLAAALISRPAVLIADEPTTALDVTVQRQILDLLRQVNKELGTATILITHDLGVIAGMCDRVAVMYAGRIVEEGRTETIFSNPQHPYTWSLLRAIPRVDAPRRSHLEAISGAPPDLEHPPSGCSFHPRCPFAADLCVASEPDLKPVASGHHAACWVTQEGGDLADRDRSL